MSHYISEFSGPIIIIGFGSIGSGVLPLLDRHFPLIPKNNIYIIDPDDTNKYIAEKYGANFRKEAITQVNYQSKLGNILNSFDRRGYIINVANEVSSYDLAEFAAENNAHYIDTVVEPWPGFYFNQNTQLANQTNYALRENLHELKPKLKNRPTAISCCGANPGMVSWLVKEALLNLATDLNISIERPSTREDWARLMQKLDVKGIHIAERDTQTNSIARAKNQFINTWSVEGCVAECLQPAELGWGTHEIEFPKDGHRHDYGSKAAIYLDKPGGTVKVQTWTPTAGPHFGFLITHNEAISIADYYTIKNGEDLVYRPTCHYAYHPTDATVKSLAELFDERDSKLQDSIKILSAAELTGGADELGVLLYGHAKGAYWYGSRLTIEETRKFASHQNATGLQVSSAIIAGMAYALANTDLGLIESDEMDFDFCLAIQKPYLGTVFGQYTEWKPDQVGSPLNEANKWQFSDMRLT